VVRTIASSSSQSLSLFLSLLLVELDIVPTYMTLHVNNGMMKKIRKRKTEGKNTQIQSEAKEAMQNKTSG
jgi:hypothetical protein